MKTMSIEMAYVSKCSIEECAFNVNAKCHAKAITIGDGLHAGCDTFLHSAGHTKAKQRMAGIGACKATSCKYNEDFECSTDHVTVGHSGKQINCMTFSPR